jgi:hypothetical protein
MKPERPTFIVHLRPEPQVDDIRALRQLLKVALRRFGLKAISIREESNKPIPPIQTIDNGS